MEYLNTTEYKYNMNRFNNYMKRELIKESSRRGGRVLESDFKHEGGTLSMRDWEKL